MLGTSWKATCLLLLLNDKDFVGNDDDEALDDNGGSGDDVAEGGEKGQRETHRLHSDRFQVLSGQGYLGRVAALSRPHLNAQLKAARRAAQLLVSARVGIFSLETKKMGIRKWD